MTNNRYRLVTHQGGAEHVSSVVLSHAEALEALRVEEDIHRLAGWSVSLTDDSVIAVRGWAARKISIRESGPMEDTL